jgi:diguanylate cyclase (GGDEF)-like protein
MPIGIVTRWRGLPRCGQTVEPIHTMGHAAGDQLLCEVSRRLNEGVRADDVIARLGGDEFAIVQANAPQPETAEELASRLLDLVSRPYRIADRNVKVGVSIGIAICRAGIFEIDGMLRRADKALYRAKLTGRGTWRLVADNGWEFEAA